MKQLKVTLYFVIFLIFGFGLVRLYLELTDDFQLAHIYYEGPLDIAINLPPLTKSEQAHLSQVLAQKFSYIGKGSQCYVFASEDQQHVLKFFKFKHLKANWLANLLTSLPPFEAYKKKMQDRKTRKLRGIFKSHELAFIEDQKNSGLVFLHLMPTNHLNQRVTIFDKIGIQRTIDLDTVVFVIQRKGETFRNRLRRELGQGQIEAAKLSFSRIIGMFVSEYKKGLYDSDNGIMQNTGFVQNDPFHLDIGHLTKKEEMKDVQVFKEDLRRHILTMNRWVQNRFPQYSSQISEFLSEQYLMHTGSSMAGGA